jgi:integration host factor subunit beta
MTKKMTKKEIVKMISDDIGLTQIKTKEIVQKTFDFIIDTLVTEGRIELRNFGVFAVKKRAARKARNPKTGQKVDVPTKFVVTFKPGKEMEKRVLEMEALEQQQEVQNEQQPDISADGSLDGHASTSDVMQADKPQSVPGESGLI